MTDKSLRNRETRPEVAPDDDESPAGSHDWLTRGEVAAVLRVSIATVRRWQTRELHPRRDDTGMYLFDPAEVEALRSSRPAPPEPRACTEAGELASEAFKMFRDGVDVRDVVIALKKPPDEIETLYAQWERMGGAVVFSEKVRGQLERLVAHRAIPAEVLEAIENDDHERLRDYAQTLVADRLNRTASR
jgi:hypothetical protein